MASIRTTLTLLLLIAAWGNLHAQPSTTLKKSGHIDSAELFKLVYVPVEVPDGITEIRVNEQCSKPGQNVINMGAYGPEGYALGNAAGFRGWSGGAKTSFFINKSAASTGYIPGKIKKGTWHILIYASTLIPEGADWNLDITLITGNDRKPFQIKTAPESVNNRPGWYSGDLHMHTLHSDGKRTQQQLTSEAAEKHLDYIISTEHNTNSATLMWGDYLQKNLLIINGEEVTTTAFGHWNAIGLKPKTWIEWRYTPQDSMINKYTNQVRRDGGLCIINHPFYTKTLTNGFLFNPDLFYGIEVWNGNWDMLDALALKWWDDMLKKGKHMLAIGASDTHQSTGSPNNLGAPQTMVYASSLSAKGIINGLKQRKAYITSSPDYKILLTAKSRESTAGIGDALQIGTHEDVAINLTTKPIPDATINIIGSQDIIKTVKATESTYTWLLSTKSTDYLRLEVRDSKGQMLILSNPIWIKRKG